MTLTYRTVDLGYKINDADNHFNEPDDCFVRYIEPKFADLASCVVSITEEVVIHAG